jgi:hypothetical protein
MPKAIEISFVIIFAFTIFLYTWLFMGRSFVYLPLFGLVSSPLGTIAARQSYDVRKIIRAFRYPHDDLTILCAHRGLRYEKYLSLGILVQF